jgi:toxin CptA
MSIAVSAVIQPSRLLRWLLFGFAACCAAAALALALVQAARFHFPYACAALCAAAAVFACLAAPATARRIDISGPGEIRLLVQHRMGGAPQTPPWQLLPFCTVWPCLMLLLLHEAGQGVAVVCILPDSVSAEQFRNLALAIRTIAGRDQEFGKHKIF